MHRKNLLRELRQLRCLMLAAAPAVSLTSTSQPARSHLLDPNLNSARNDTCDHQFADETLDITSRTLLTSHELPRYLHGPSGHNSNRKQRSSLNAFSSTTRDLPTSEARRNNVDDIFPLRKSPLDSQSPTDGALAEHQRMVESSSHSSIPHQNPFSVPQPLPINNLSILHHILLSYRCLNRMREAYCSTPSPPFFATYSTGAFSLPAPYDPLQTNTRLNLIDPKTVRQANSYQFSIRPSPQNGRNGRTYRHRYVPPLLAKLFHEQEFSNLFDSKLRYTFSTQDTSLNKASELYLRSLFPAPRRNLVMQSRSDRMPARIRGASAANGPFFSSDNGARSGPSVSRLEFPSRIEFKLPLSNTSKFQLQTFHHSLVRRTRHRVPKAQWHGDLAQKKPVVYAERPSRSHHAYAIALNDRGLPHYTGPQADGFGVTRGASTERALPFQNPTGYPFRKTYGMQTTEKACSATHGSTMRAFGFQSRTNYPFRRTFGPPRNKEMCLAPSNIPPRISPEFASRVPVGGLSTTLLQLFDPGIITHGLFFSEYRIEDSMGLESKGAEVLYTICDEGRLVPVSQDD